MPLQLSSSAVAATNETAWARGEFVPAYANRTLRPVEVLLFVRLRENLTGCVLELGSGAGRIGGYLVALAREFHGIDLAPQMVAESRRRYPAGDFAEGDMRDLTRFDDGSLDAVIAGCNLLDVFDDAERRRVLREIRRVLAPNGVLIMSSHNRAYLPRVRPPWHVRLTGLLHGRPRGLLEFAADLVRAPRRIRRHQRLRGLERRTPDFAIVSDGAHEFSLVHYFTDPVAQFRQFREEGLEPELAADLEGRAITTGDQAADCPEIHYVARKPAN
ncbi:MAG: methyltransferase domain-containing protein [Solirubrobacteraceae bacterium]